MNTWNIYISTLAQIVLLFNVLIGWRLYRMPQKFMTYFHAYLLLALVIQVTAKIIMFQVGTNLPLLHVYTFLEFILLSLFYKELFFPKGKYRKYATFIIGIISGLIILNTIFLQPIDRFNSNAKTLTHIIYISCAIYFFFKFFSHQFDEDEIMSTVLNLLNSSILVYYSGSLFIFMFGNIFIEIGGNQIFFWILNSLLYLGFQVVIFYCLWKITSRRMKFT